MKRFLFASLLVAVAGGVAGADDILEPYAPFKLVGMMPDTGQVLLYSDGDGAYRVARMGDNLDGWRLSGIDAKSLRVSLQREDLIDDLELVRLPKTGAVIVFREPTRDPRVASTAPAPAPAVVPTSTPPGGIAPTVIETRPTTEAPPPPPPAQPAPPPPPPPPPKPIEEARTLARNDVDRQINDFDHLMATVKVAAADGGGFTIIKLEPKSWIASLGFKQGDTVRKIAGDEVSTVEDAAKLYARLRSLDNFAAEVDRGLQRVVLKFEVK